MFKISSGYNLIVGLSEKNDGPMSSPGFLVSKFDDEIIVSNRKKFFKKIGITPEAVVTVGSLHKNHVQTVSIGDAGRVLGNVDGLLTQAKDLYLTLTVADCLPVYLFDPENKVVGLLHCGWRGIVSNILEGGISNMVKEFGSLPQNILVGIGPGIAKCHFEVGKDVAEKLDSSEKFVDLKRIVKERLLTLGLDEGNMETSPDCTFCLVDKYFSFRRDKPQTPQTMVAVIGMKDG